MRGCPFTTTATLDFSKPHVLHTEAEYDAALEEIERLHRVLGIPADVLLGVAG